MSHRYFLFALVLLLPGLAQAQDCPVPGLLEILNPGDIAGIYDAAPMSGDPGAWGDTTGLIPPGLTGNIVHVDDDGDFPGEGCVALTNPDEINGNIALISRGSCEFGLKAFNAQEAGAVGFIIYNGTVVPDDDMTILDPPFMGGGVNGPDVFIPGVFVSRAIGLAMRDQLLKFGVAVEGNIRYQDCYAPVAIEPGPDGTPGTHALSTANPNPFNGRTSFSLEVAQVQDVSVEVFNALGQRVAVLHQGAMTPGAAHAFTLNATNLPSGVYFYRATGETFSETRSIVLAR